MPKDISAVYLSGTERPFQESFQNLGSLDWLKIWAQYLGPHIDSAVYRKKIHVDTTLVF